MKKKFGVFYEDLCDLNAIYGEFLKKHWLGVAIYVVICTIAYVGFFCLYWFNVFEDIGNWFTEKYKSIKQFFKRKFHKA